MVKYCKHMNLHCFQNYLILFLLKYFRMCFIPSKMSHNTLRRADPKEKVINEAKKLIPGNEVGKAKEVWLTSFMNETNGTVLNVPKSIMHPPPWDLLSQRNIEHLQRLIMQPNPPAPQWIIAGCIPH